MTLQEKLVTDQPNIDSSETEEKTEVYFALSKEIETSNAEVVAFFPKEEYYHYESDTKVCYVHVGGHSACALNYIEEDTRPATKKEYQPLLAELKSLGYDLKIVNSYK